jgi:hypothetical protein
VLGAATAGVADVGAAADADPDGDALAEPGPARRARNTTNDPRAPTPPTIAQSVALRRRD